MLRPHSVMPPQNKPRLKRNIFCTAAFKMRLTEHDDMTFLLSWEISKWVQTTQNRNPVDGARSWTEVQTCGPMIDGITF